MSKIVQTSSYKRVKKVPTVEEMYKRACEQYGRKFNESLKDEKYRVILNSLSRTSLDDGMAQTLLAWKGETMGGKFSTDFPLAKVPGKAYVITGFMSAPQYNQSFSNCIFVALPDKGRDARSMIVMWRAHGRSRPWEVHDVPRTAEFFFIIHSEINLPYDTRLWDSSLALEGLLNAFLQASVWDVMDIPTEDPLRSKRLLPTMASTNALYQIRKANIHPSKAQNRNIDAEVREHAKKVSKEASILGLPVKKKGLAAKLVPTEAQPAQHWNVSVDENFSAVINNAPAPVAVDDDYEEEEDALAAEYAEADDDLESNP